MKNLTDNPMQPDNLAKASRCGAKTRSGGKCRLPAVIGRQRCRMHGGTNAGAPKANSNARKHGNRSAEAEEQLKIVREADRDLRVLGKVRQGIELTVRERDRLVQMHVASRHKSRLADASQVEPKEEI